MSARFQFFCTSIKSPMKFDLEAFRAWRDYITFSLGFPIDYERTTLRISCHSSYYNPFENWKHALNPKGNFFLKLSLSRIHKLTLGLLFQFLIGEKSLRFNDWLYQFMYREQWNIKYIIIKEEFNIALTFNLYKNVLITRMIN